MRLSQYLNEGWEGMEEVEKFIEVVKKECSPWLKESQYKPAYRGITKGMGSIVTYDKEVRTDRKPLTSNATAHAVWDAGFNKVFGWKARSSGLFVTGKIVSTFNYGSPYIVFPVGEFKYIWSDEVRDLYINQKDVIAKLNKTDKGNPTRKGADVIVGDWIKSKKYRDTGLGVALLGSSEIMVKCEKFHAIYLPSVDMWCKEKYPSMAKLRSIDVAGTLLGSMK